MSKARTYERAEGWELCGDSLRHHYFRNGESLCGKYRVEKLTNGLCAPTKEMCCRQCFQKLMREP